MCVCTCADTGGYVNVYMWRARARVRTDPSVLCPQLPRDNIQFARKPPDFVRGRSSTRLLRGSPRAFPPSPPCTPQGSSSLSFALSHNNGMIHTFYRELLTSEKLTRLIEKCQCLFFQHQILFDLKGNRDEIYIVICLFY